MNRAERRKHGIAKPHTYTITKERLDAMVREEVKKAMERERQKIYDDAVNKALGILLALPIWVLMEDWWQKSYKRNLPKFVGRVLELYEDWQYDRLDLDIIKDEIWHKAGLRIDEKG